MSSEHVCDSAFGLYLLYEQLWTMPLVCGQVPSCSFVVHRVGIIFVVLETERPFVPCWYDFESVLGHAHNRYAHLACQGFQRLSNKALAMTLTELSAMAAPAIIGFKYPKAANGMPATL